MRVGRASIVGILDASPFALGLGAVLWTVGDQFAPEALFAISVLLALGIGALLAVVSASRYVADGTRFVLVRSVADALLWWV